jgi:L-asparaginase II
MVSRLMEPPISVLLRRGPAVESVHRVHAAAVRDDGELVAHAGDPDLVTFMRSSAKPIQALPLARAHPDLSTAELAIACASHLADANQLAAVESLLARAHAREDDLECGPEGNPPRRLHHNCSGKHAGMLAVCRARGWPTEGYRRPDHPLQRELLVEVERAAGMPPTATAVDGCGVVTFALPLKAMARAFTTLDLRIAHAMRAHPDLIRGERAADTMLMRALPGWVAKGGAEGLMCAAGAGIGVALKAEDGAHRAVKPALAAFLGRLGHALPEAFAVVAVENSRGEQVGELVAAS